MASGILLVCDSQGEGLQRFLTKQLSGHTWKLWVLRGKGLRALIRAALNEQRLRHYAAVIISGGICDITIKDNRNRKIAVRHDAADQIVERVFDDIKDEMAMLREESKITLVTTTYGLDLWNYNMHMFGEYSNPNHLADQRKLEQVVDLLNGRIAQNNSVHDITTVRVGNKIHHKRKAGKTSSSYQHLWDGCHPNEELIQTTANDLVSSINRYVPTEQ